MGCHDLGSGQLGINKEQEIMMKRSLLSLTIASILASLQPAVSLAATGDPLPHQFQSGSKARAAEVNENFQNLADRIATVADQAGTAALSYDFQDFLPSNDLVKLFEPIVGGTYRENSISYEWLDQGESRHLHVIEDKTTLDGGKSRVLKVLDVDDHHGLRLMEKRFYSLYGEDLTGTTEWEEPLAILPAQTVKGEIWAVDGLCSKKDSSGVTEQCYAVGKRTVIGVETVKTPAGTFTGCLKILHELPDGMDIYWLAPDLGRVKWATSRQRIDEGEIGTRKRVWLLSSYQSQGNNRVTHSGSVWLLPEFTDNAQIAKVEYYHTAVDESKSNLLATREGGNWGHQIDYAAADNGDYTYIIQAYNSLGEVISTQQRVIKVSIDGDQVAPTVTLTATPGTVTETGAAELTVTSSDTDIARVEFKRGDRILSTDLTPPYSYSVDFDALDDSNQQFTAVATDLGGNRSQASSASIVVAMASPNATADSYAKAKALVNEIRAMTSSDTTTGIGQLANPVDAFSEEIDLANSAASTMVDHKIANLGEIAGMVSNHYLGKTSLEITGTSYDLTQVGGTGSGSIVKTTSNGVTQYHVTGTINQDAVDLTLIFPEYNAVAGPYVVIALSGWVGQDSNSDRLQLDGKALIELRQRVVFNDQLDRPSNSADLYVAGLEFELDVDLNLQRSGEADFNYRGSVRVAGVMDLISQLYHAYYDDYNDRWNYYYGTEIDLLPTTVVLNGEVSEGTDLLAFKAEAKLSGAPTYPPRIGDIKKDLAHYSLSADGMTLTFAFMNGQTLVFTYDSSINQISIGGDLASVSYWMGHVPNLSPYGNSHSDIIAALGNINSTDLLSLSRLIDIVDEGEYQFKLDNGQIWNLSRSGGTVSGEMVRPEMNYDLNENRVKSLHLSFGGKLGNLPQGRVDLEIDREIVNTHSSHLSFTATIAYDTAATEIAVKAVDSGADSEGHIVYPVTIRSQDGAVIELVETGNVISGDLAVHGVDVGTLSEISGGVKVEYNDGSSDLF